MAQGEPILADVVLENAGTEPMSLGRRGLAAPGNLGLVASIEGKHFFAVSAGMDRPTVKPAGPQSPRALAPGERLSTLVFFVQFELDVCLSGEPGTVHVRVDYAAPDGIELSSEIVPVDVIATSSTPATVLDSGRRSHRPDCRCHRESSKLQSAPAAARAGRRAVAELGLESGAAQASWHWSYLESS